MISLRRLRVPSILLLALVAALAFAGPAAAETLTGEGVATGTEPEAEVVSAKASYEKSTGAVNFTITTGAEPQTEVDGAPSTLTVITYLFDEEAGCTLKAIEESSGPGTPSVEIGGEYATRSAGFFLTTSSSAPPTEGAATMAVSGTTTSLSVASPQLANLGFNCAVAFIPVGGFRPAVFAMSVKQETPVVVTPTPPAPSGAFSLAKIKPLKAKEGKWTKVKVKVTNSGNAAIGPVAIKLKAPKGVVVKSGTTKLPALLTGQSWTVMVEVKVTAKAKKSSTVKVTTSSGALSAKGSFVLKRAG